jgi:phosphate starvation-inducible PhoH-like protein
MAERRITISDSSQMQEICGSFDDNLKALEKQYCVSVVCRGDELKISGDEEAAANAESAVQAMLHMSETGQPVNVQTVRYVTSMVNDGEADEIGTLTDDGVCLTATGKVVRAKTVGQKKYVDAIRKNTIVFGVGPAGTGKTYLAVAMAVKAFKRHEVNRIILTRPAVEAGEKLGFLPGDLQNKVDPYLRPLYDALFEMLGAEPFQKHMERGSIEVAPLAYMRGRTLDNAFIILDEAQNTTSEQLKMFLTRLGDQSRMVITGDVTQIDLPDKRKCGLLEAMKILRRVDDIYIHEFTNKDVVRHKLVQDIIRAYEKYYHGKGDSDAGFKGKGISKKQSEGN